MTRGIADDRISPSARPGATVRFPLAPRDLRGSNLLSPIGSKADLLARLVTVAG